MRDFDDNEFPLAYLITMRCYGTWLHGDDRASTDRKHNVYGSSRIAPNPKLNISDLNQLKHSPSKLNSRQRGVVERAIREVCAQRRYALKAINVRTNHVHVVVAAMEKPEQILNAFKAYSTRALRQADAISRESRPWSRHGSTVYLWKERDVAKAMEYVALSQGVELFQRDS